MSEQVKPWNFVYQEAGVSSPPFDERAISEYVSDYAKSIPDFPAIKYFNLEISYQALDKHANQLANALVALGVGKDDVVGFHMPNIPQYVCALLAVSKIGCAGSGVSPLLAPLELAYQINDANISVLISLDGLVGSSVAGMRDRPVCLKSVIATSATDFLAPGLLTLPGLEGVQVQSYLELVSEQPESFEQRAVHWDDTYLIQYTGGTTGAPKGAMLSVRSTR